MNDVFREMLLAATAAADGADNYDDELRLR